jgi:hypothetical protein
MRFQFAIDFNDLSSPIYVNLLSRKCVSLDVSRPYVPPRLVAGIALFFICTYRCLFCGLIRRPEDLIGRHCYLQPNWRSFIRWSPEQWVSLCYAIECYRSFYCALFCLHDSRWSMSNQPALWPLRIRNTKAFVKYFICSCYIGVY